jgi:hypothetical protein
MWPEDAEGKLFARVARYMEGIGGVMNDRKEGEAFMELGRYLAETAAKGQPFEVSYDGLDIILESFRDVSPTWKDASAKIGGAMLLEMTFVQMVHATPVPDILPDDIERIFKN